jgi:hypothetical protein
MTSKKKIMTEEEVMNFAAWYAYELHKFTFGNTRSTEPILKEYLTLNKVNHAE